MKRYVGAIDQGTTSTRFVIIDDGGSFVSVAQMEHDQVLPRPGWVEHRAEQIWDNTAAVIEEALAKASLTPSDLAGIGITNQRETSVLWDRTTGRPVVNAIVWQDTRTADLAKQLGQDHGVEWFRERTGLPPATYFSGPKVRWLLDRYPHIAEGTSRSGRSTPGLRGT